VFNSEDNDQTESFSEAYKSQILNHDDDVEEKSSKNIIIILTLVVVILGLGIFGYTYLSETKKTTESTETMNEDSSDESEELATPPESTMLNNISELTEEDDSEEKSNPKEVLQEVSVPKAEPIDTKKETISEMDEIADNVKLEIAKELSDEDLTDNKKEVTPPPVSSNQKAEDTYLEQLAELSKEIDGGK